MDLAYIWMTLQVLEVDSKKSDISHRKRKFVVGSKYKISC